MKRHIVVKNTEINLSEVVYYDFDAMEGRAVGIKDYLNQIYNLLCPQIYYKIVHNKDFDREQMPSIIFSDVTGEKNITDRRVIICGEMTDLNGDINYIYVNPEISYDEYIQMYKRLCSYLEKNDTTNFQDRIYNYLNSFSNYVLSNDELEKVRNDLGIPALEEKYGFSLKNRNGVKTEYKAIGNSSFEDIRNYTEISSEYNQFEDSDYNLDPEEFPFN